MRILIAEDDENMCKILKLYLLKEGYSVHTVDNGEDAVAYFETNEADLLILDWMMPKKDGLEVCKEIKSLNIPVKIIMLTAKTASHHELLGLVTGADDYIKKPFDMQILLVRIKKLCSSTALLRFQNISINPVSHEVFKDDNRVELTKKEYDLLKYFMANPNMVLSREQLLNHVWGMDYDGEYRTVDTHIRRLRKKLGGSYIQTRFGSGYILEAEHE